MKSFSLLLAGAIGFIAVAGVTDAVAEGRRGGDEQRALAKTQYMLKQVSGERDTLKAENDKLKAELEAAGKKSTSQKKNADAALGKLKDDNAQLSERLQQAERTIAEQQTAKQRIDTLSAAQARSLGECVSNNAALVQLNLELTDIYKDKGVLDALLQSEPITGLKQVRIENLIEEYRDRIVTLDTRQSLGFEGVKPVVAETAAGVEKKTE